MWWSLWSRLRLTCDFKKTSYDDPEYGTPSVDSDRNLVEKSDPAPTFSFYDLNASVMIGLDLHQDGIPMQWQGHGWRTALDYHEFPLEIQCSESFVAQYRLGIDSRWGDVYNELSDQIDQI